MIFGESTWNTTGYESQTTTIKLCEFCNKRYHGEDDVECDYCLNYYFDCKFYSCHSPDFISRKWLRICYKLKIPYKFIRFFFKRDVI